MKCEKSSKPWKKNLTASILLSLLLAVPVGTLTQDQVYGSLAAAQERDKEMKAGGMLEEQMDAINQAKELLRAQYGVNKRITDGQYDRSLAVKCVNGTFVGKKTENMACRRRKLHYAAAHQWVPGIFQAGHCPERFTKPNEIGVRRHCVCECIAGCAWMQDCC